jgi:hypothetical protein
VRRLERKVTLLPKAPTIKPGQPAPASGQYIPHKPGAPVKGPEVTMIKDKPAPPTPKPGMVYTPVDITKHKK